MGAAGALDVSGEIQALVFDKLQVVSYKWLSRNFSVSSNDAKSLLQDFVSKHGEGLEVIYALSGWLKENPPVYDIRLVPSSKLSEAKKNFREKCSVHVYSVQASIPKDPAAIWNVEFVQAEELFDQPLTLTNCLRDNRFCGISNSSVSRAVNGKATVIDPPLPTKIEVNLTGVKIEPAPENPSPAKEKANSSTSSEKKVEREKVKQGEGGKSLTNMWGRASVKSRPPEVNETSRVSATSDGQISAQEALEPISSDDEWHAVPQKDSSGSKGRKRRVVFDSSDEENEEEAVDLSASEPRSNCQSESGQNREVNVECQYKEVKAEPVSSSPKKKKVLKTRIDERGREVTEVVWGEGDVAEKGKVEVALADSTSRPPPAPKSAPTVPRQTPSAKAGGGRAGKAGGPKDAKQPNILSFFKKS